MNRILTILFSLMCINIYAQDIITTKQGDEIEAKVVKIGTTEIEYKKWSNVEGPSYTLLKNQVFMIKFQNGEKEVFESEKGQDDIESSSQKCVLDGKSVDNDELINMHNKIPEFASLKQSRKKAKEFFPIMAISENSVIATDKLEMKLVPECVADYDFNNRYRIKYNIRLKNKTGGIIYIDKAQCFRKDNNDASSPFFDPKQISVSLGNQSGIGVGTVINNGAGVVGIGGGTSNMQTSTYSQQRFIYIPPYAEVNLSEYVYDEIRKVKTIFTKNHKVMFDIETWDFTLYDWSGTLHKDEVIECSEENSPHRTEYHIIYSTDKDFKTFSVLNAKLYTKYLVGRDYNSWDEVFSFDRIRKFIPNFVGAEGETDILIGQPNKARIPRAVGGLIGGGR